MHIHGMNRTVLPRRPYMPNVEMDTNRGVELQKNKLMALMYADLRRNPSSMFRRSVILCKKLLSLRKWCQTN